MGVHFWAVITTKGHWELTFQGLEAETNPSGHKDGCGAQNGVSLGNACGIYRKKSVTFHNI